MRFNPFKSVNCARGAPMGRCGHDVDTFPSGVRLYARHCGGDGYYDRGGAYWGHSDVWALWTRGGELCAYVTGRDARERVRLSRYHRASSRQGGLR